MSNITITTGPFALNMGANSITNCNDIACNSITSGSAILSSNQPSFMANLSTTPQTLTVNVLTPILFNTTVYNKNGCVSYNAGTGTITFLRDGNYAVYANALWGTLGVGNRLLEFSTSNLGRCAVAISPIQTSTPQYSTTSMNFYFNANDTLQVRALTNSGASLQIINSVTTHVVITQLS
jgi:hypothetical protein